MTGRAIASEGLGFVDVVIASSHNHTDHLDAETLVPLCSQSGAAPAIPAANRAFVAERLGCGAPAGRSGLDAGRRSRPARSRSRRSRLHTRRWIAMGRGATAISDMLMRRPVDDSLQRAIPSLRWYGRDAACFLLSTCAVADQRSWRSAAPPAT